MSPQSQTRGSGTPIFSISGVRAIPESMRGLKGMSSPLVARQAEWDQLQTVLAQLLAGRGQIVSVTEAGLGKSRLVVQLRQHLRAHATGLLWLEGHCLSYTETVSFLPFQQVLRQWANIRTDDNEQEAHHKLRALLGKVLPDNQALAHLPYLATFLNLPLEDTLPTPRGHLFLMSPVLRP